MSKNGHSSGTVDGAHADCNRCTLFDCSSAYVDSVLCKSEDRPSGCGSASDSAVAVRQLSKSSATHILRSELGKDELYREG
jgi:hypothetical protein